MPPISMVICCANVEHTLTAACESSAWADELVVVDSGSTDATERIARRYADRYVQEPWRGYTKQKQFGASLASHEWVFVLDGDETCTPELAREIRALQDRTFERCDVMWMRRRNYVMGRYVRAWDPDWQSRLIHRGRCRWADEVLHDARLPSDPSRQHELRGRIEHNRHSRAGFKDDFHGAEADRRLLPVARQMYARGRRCRWWDLAFRPTLAFVKFYFTKRACLDGTFGLLIAQKAARGTQLKYAALWAVQQGVEPAEPELESRKTGPGARPTHAGASSVATDFEPTGTVDGAREADPPGRKPDGGADVARHIVARNPTAGPDESRSS